MLLLTLIYHYSRISRSMLKRCGGALDDHLASVLITAAYSAKDSSA